MKTLLKTFSTVAVFAAIMLTTAGFVDAQRRNDKAIRDATNNAFSKLDDFESEIRSQMQSSSANDQSVNEISDKIRTLRDNLFQYQENFDRKRENRDDVNQIIDAARRIDDYLKSNPQNRRVQDSWLGARAQLDRIASNYGVTSNWNGETDTVQNVKDYPPYPTSGQKYPNSGQTYPTSGQTYPTSGKTYPTPAQTYPTPVQDNVRSVGLSGTYTLDRTTSENIDDIVANTNLADDQRQDLKEKLEPPEQIAMDIRGNQVTLATTNVSPVTVVADGRDKTEQAPNGKTVRTRATLSGQTLTVSSLGGDTDYTITFTSVSDGKTLKVSRRITTEYISQTVFAESVYNKTDPVAQLGIQPSNNTNPSNTTNPGNPPVDQNGSYSDNDNSTTVANGGSPNRGNPRRTYPTGGNQNRGIPTTVQVRPGNYIVPNGTILTGNLENEINTGVSQNNDRFRLTVQSPDEYRGATIEGYISNVRRSGKVSGQAGVTFNFEKITLRNGQTYDYAGSLQGITDQTGKVIMIDNEGSARGNNQTRQTATRGGIGAGLGALIGAIAGGGKGAAIGAILGGGAGAGSVYAQGKNDIRLTQGSTLTIQSAAPSQQNTK